MSDVPFLVPANVCGSLLSAVRNGGHAAGGGEGQESAAEADGVRGRSASVRPHGAAGVCFRSRTRAAVLGEGLALTLALFQIMEDCMVFTLAGCVITANRKRR